MRNIFFTAIPIILALGFSPVRTSFSKPAQKDRASSPAKKKDVAQIKAEMHKKEKLIKRLKSKEVSILGVVEEMGQKLRTDKIRLDTINVEKKGVAVEIQKLNSDVETLNVEIKGQESLIMEGLRNSYKMGKSGFMKILLASDSYRDFSKKKYFIQYLVKSEDELRSSYLANQQLLESKLLALKDRGDRLGNLSQEAQSKVESLSRSREEKLSVLKAVKSEKELHEKSVAELSKAARDLEKMIVAMPRRDALGQGKFIQNRGLLNLPVRGKVEVRYGEYFDPTLNVRIFSKGVGIGISEEQPVRAVHAGKVIYAGAFVGYGNIIIIDHGENYYSLYARLKSLVKIVGDVVGKGDEIGSAGDPEEDSKSQFYFELRHNGLPVDPAPWFKSNGSLK